ncbi:unnamed protein product [Knipowitschia caucasica]|uniref:C2H2-type domain-containing protein n=1 Tax=Knipowitschia caucasica TaxID=637954 RepID=A0AAV2KML9_KNICA
MYASTNPGSAHADFQDRNGVSYVSSAESFGHCSQLFWKKDPSDSGPSWCDQPLSLETGAPPPAPSAAAASAPAPAPDDSESDERPYVCDLCNCAYKHASSLLNHKLTHRIGDFKCDFCSKPYTNYMSLRNHMRIHGQKRYMCDLCGKAFRLARYLRNHQRIHDDGPNRFDCPSCCKSYRTMLELAQHRCSAANSGQSSSRRSNYSAQRRQQQQQQQHQQQQQQHQRNTSMMQHPAHGPQEPLPSHCVSPMPQGAPPNQTVPDHQVCASVVSSQRSSSKMVSSPSPVPSSYSLLQPLVPEAKHQVQDTFSLAPQRPLSTLSPMSHSLHPNGAASLKPSPVARSIQPMPWEQRSLYNQ